MSDSAGNGWGGRIRGALPMVVAGVVVFLLLRSCVQGYEFPWQDDDESATADDAAPDNGERGDVSQPSTTLSDDELQPLLEAIPPECPPEDNEVRHLQWTEAPPMCIDTEMDYTATLETSRGDIVIDLDTENAPETVNNFVFLARWHYYDNSEFHTVRPGLSVGAGDPIGDPPGTFDPGYNLNDEALPVNADPAYPLYSVAMVTSGPDTAGSTFHIQSGTESIPEPIYPRFGQITDQESQAVVNEIDATGIRRAGHDGTPSEPTTIYTVTIEER